MTIDLIVRSCDDKHCFTTYDSAFVQVWRGEVTLLSIAALERGVRQLAAEVGAGKKVSSISVVEAQSPPPAEALRRDLARVYRDLAPLLHEAILVPEGGGFRAALVRGVGVALSTFAPRALPFRFVDSIAAACAIVAPRLAPAAGGVKGLEAAIEQTRAGLRGAASSR